MNDDHAGVSTLPESRADQRTLAAAFVMNVVMLVNMGVLIAGALIALSGYRVIDLIAGVVIVGFVIHEGWELWELGGRGDAADSSS